MKLLPWLKAQKAHFLTLSKPERSLLLSFFLFGLASPIIYTFSNTFIWRGGQDPIRLIFFNAAFYAFLPVGFFLNALAFRLTDAPKMYFIGCLLQGITPFALVMSGAPTSLVPFFGALLGLSGGFYWANRNYLTSKVTQGHNRLYFMSIEGALGTIAAVIAPVTIGWLLVIGERLSLYSVDNAYRIAAILSLLILCVAGWAVTSAGLPPCKETLDRIFLRAPGALWKQLRLMEMVNGFIHGTEVIVPTVIILTVLGTEETLGTIYSLMAIFTAVILAVASRRIKHQHHLMILCLWTIGDLIGGAGFAILASAGGAIFYFVMSGLCGSLRWTSIATIMYEIVDSQSEAGKAHRYVYIMDREIFLNIGRLCAAGLLFVLYTNTPALTTRFGLLLIVLAQLVLLAVVKPVLAHIRHRNLPVAPTLDQKHAT